MINENFPELSLKERDGRWARVRAFMREKGLDVLIAFGLKGREQVDHYLTNDRTGGIVIFPLAGELVHLTWTNFDIAAHSESALRGEASWVEDVRVGATGAGVVKVLREKRLDGSCIGVLGLDAELPGESEGWVPYKTWARVLEQLPGARWVEVSGDFFKLMLVKSEEELKLLRRAAAIGELACETMLDIARPGVSESEVYAGVMATLYRCGARGSVSPYITPLILQSGPDNPGWGAPMWLMRGQRPRTLQAGDLVQAEVFSAYGCVESQQQMSVALKPVHPANEECAQVARSSYDAALKVLKPGITFDQVAEAMEAPLAEADCWHLTPLIHSLNPLAVVSATGVRMPEKMPGIEKYVGIQARPVKEGNLVIQPGMAFALEPNACKGRNRVNIGGTVIVTPNGVEELNKVAAKMQMK